MGLGATIVGTAYGVSTMLITNAMRKTALFQRPWEIVIAGGVGAFVANQAMDFEHFLEVRVQEMARDRILNNKEVMEEEYRQILGPRFDKWFPEVRPTAPDPCAARHRHRIAALPGVKLWQSRPPPAAARRGWRGRDKSRRRRCSRAARRWTRGSPRCIGERHVRELARWRASRSGRRFYVGTARASGARGPSTARIQQGRVRSAAHSSLRVRAPFAGTRRERLDAQPNAQRVPLE